MSFGKRLPAPAAAFGDPVQAAPPRPEMGASAAPARAGGLGGRVFTAVLLLYALVVAGGALREGWRMHRLHAQGRPAAAVVTAKAAERRRYGHWEHRLSFRFVTERGREVQAVGFCSPAAYAATPVGAATPVLYDPADPGNAQPDPDHTLRSGPDAGLREAALVLFVLAAAVLGAAAFTLVRTLNPKRSWRRGGDGAWADAA